MRESFRYIETLFNVAKTAFFDGDWEFTMIANKNYREMLSGLDYITMQTESLTPNAKENIMKLESNDDGAKVSVKRLKEEIGEMYQDMNDYITQCKEYALEHFQNGDWNDEQYERAYNETDCVKRLWIKRLKEITDVYEIKLSVKVENLPVRTNGRKPGKERIIRPDSDFNRKELEKGSTFEGAKYMVPVEHFFDIVERCLFKDVDEDHLRNALQQANPHAIANGNRLDILYFVYKKYGTHDDYVAHGMQNDYIQKVQDEFHRINPDYDFRTLPHKDIQDEIWDSNKNDFKKNTKNHQKMLSPKGHPDY